METLEALVTRALDISRPAREGKQDPRVARADLARFYASVEGGLDDATNAALVTRLETICIGLASRDAAW